MTGNTVLLAVALGGGNFAALWAPLVAVGAFIAGAWIGTRAMATDSLSATRALVIELGAVIVLAVLSHVIGTRDERDRLVLIACAAATMAFQQIITYKIAAGTGTSTTFMSSTVVRIGAALASFSAGNRAALAHNGSIWLVYAGAAACAALATRFAPPLLAIAPILFVAAAAVILSRSKDSNSRI